MAELCDHGAAAPPPSLSPAPGNPILLSVYEFASLRCFIYVESFSCCDHALGVWLLSLSMTSSRFIQVIAYVRMSLLFKGEWYSTVCGYHILLTPRTPCRTLALLPPLTAVNNAAVNMVFEYRFGPCFQSSCVFS